MTKHCSGVLTLFCSVAVFVCQGQSRIDTDRPDQTESASTVPSHYLQAEWGFNRETVSGSQVEWVHPTLLVKYGFRRWELRLETCTRSLGRSSGSSGKQVALEPVELGFKLALLEEKNWLPQTSLIVHLAVPQLASRIYRSQTWVPSARLAMQHGLTNNLGLGCNLGVNFDQPQAPPQWLYTFSPGMEFGKRWYAYMEAFGFIRRNEAPEHLLAAGLAYYLNKDWKLDLSGGFGISRAAAPNYLAIGFSFRVPVLKTHLANSRTPER